MKPKSNEMYISKIRKRLNEDESARSEREKRRRKVLVEQQRAHQAQEVSYLAILDDLKTKFEFAISVIVVV